MAIPVGCHCMQTSVPEASAPAENGALPGGSACPDQPRIITLRGGGQTQVLPVADILYAEVFDHELHIHTVDGKLFRGRGHLSCLEKQLAAGFLRCHKSYLVHLACVTGLRRYRITLAGGVEIPVSKQNYLSIQQQVSAYLQKAAGQSLP